MARKSMKQTEIGVIFLIIVAIIILVIIYVFRFILFGVTLKIDSSPESWLKEGYGYYSKTQTYPCVSETGFCNGKASQYNIQICNPNPTTGRGCLDEKGRNQTFNPIASKVSCIPQCYIGIWNTQVTSGCQVQGASTCVTRGAIGKSTFMYECKSVDGKGINACTIHVPSNIEKADVAPPIPKGPYQPVMVYDPNVKSIPGCTVNGRNIASCEVGVKLVVRSECVPSSDLYPQCGFWGVVVEEDGKVNTTKTEKCETSLDFDTTKDCFSFSNGNKLSQITDLYTIGYYQEKTRCVDRVGSYSNDGIACKQQPGCQTSSQSVLNVIDQQTESGSVFSCIPSQGSDPKCIKTCFYYNFGTLASIPQSQFNAWAGVIALPKFLVLGDKNKSTQELDLALNHIPCNTQKKYSYIENGNNFTNSTINALQSAMPPLSDCFGNPDYALNEVPMIAYNPFFIADNSPNINFPECSKDNIRNSTSLIVIIKPISVTRLSSINGDLLKCHIIGIQGVGYLGMLRSRNRDGNSKWIIWKQASFTDLSGYIGDDDRTFCITTPDSNGRFDIYDYSGKKCYVLRQTNDAQNYIEVSQCKAVTLDSNVHLRDMDGVEFQINPLKQEVPKPGQEDEDIDTFPNFHTLLNYRSTRQNPYTCNAFYSYPPPLEYKEYDVGISFYEDKDGGQDKIYWISNHGENIKPHDE